jgi:AraC-like DNA-binding protein
MDLLKAKRYRPRRPLLRRLIKHYWAIRTERPITFHHKLLPMITIDLVFDFSCPGTYHSGEKVEQVPRYSFRGVSDEYYVVRQSGTLDMLGVSFLPGGLYSLLKTPLSEFRNRTFDLDSVIPNSLRALDQRLGETESTLDRLEALEVYLMELIDPQLIAPANTNRLIRSFCAPSELSSVKSFCDQYGIGQRTLERLFHLRTGVAPKTFHKINRFRRALNRLLDKRYRDMTSLAYEYGYYDQAHFIKDFRAFTGCSPSQFVNNVVSMKQLLQIIYHDKISSGDCPSVPHPSR